MVIDAFKGENLINDPNEKVSEILRKLDLNEFDLFQKVTKSKKTEKVFYGFLMIFSQFLNNKDELVSLKEYGDKNDLGKDGEGPGYFLTQFNLKQTMSIVDFIKEFIFKHIIYRHQYVAFRKIRGGGLSTQKFIIEDHHIRYLEILMQRIQDLNWKLNFISKRLKHFIKDNQLTEKEPLWLIKFH